MVDSPVALRNSLRRLADWPTTYDGVLSAYLDLRPQATQNPNVRTGLVVLRDRLRDIRRDDGRAADTLDGVADRIEAEIERRMPDVHGLAVFATPGGQLEVAETRRTLDNEVRRGARPHLWPLARLADAEQAAIALIDTNTLRLFVHRSGALEEMGLLDDSPQDYSQTSKGGWSQARFQRHVDAHREAFAKLAADAIDDIVELEDAEVLLLAGDEVAVPLLRDELPTRLLDMTRGTLRLGMRASLQEVEQDALPVLERLNADDATDAADRLVGATLAKGMGVGGIEQTRGALALGQALELVVDSDLEAEDEVRDELVGLAAATDARVRFVADHTDLRDLGGVGALLRFRLDRPRNEPVAAGRRSG